jgi:hypothetical protein
MVLALLTCIGARGWSFTAVDLISHMVVRL